MNETMSVLLATTVLALGGLGLYMFKSDNQTGGDKYNEDDIFDDYSDDESLSDSDSDSDSELDYEPEPEPESKKSKAKNAAKTKRNQKSGGTKRKYDK